MGEKRKKHYLGILGHSIGREGLKEGCISYLPTQLLVGDSDMSSLVESYVITV